MRYEYLKEEQRSATFVHSHLALGPLAIDTGRTSSTSRPSRNSRGQQSGLPICISMERKTDRGNHLHDGGEAPASQSRGRLEEGKARVLEGLSARENNKGA
jgi:hypothetical protein